jgi:hypothetical protein
MDQSAFSTNSLNIFYFLQDIESPRHRFGRKRRNLNFLSVAPALIFLQLLLCQLPGWFWYICEGKTVSGLIAGISYCHIGSAPAHKQSVYLPFPSPRSRPTLHRPTLHCTSHRTSRPTSHLTSVCQLSRSALCRTSTPPPRPSPPHPLTPHRRGHQGDGRRHGRET